jgi:hypothetical protein
VAERGLNEIVPQFMGLDHINVKNKSRPPAGSGQSNSPEQ